jgi:hypothetical protein
MDCQKIGAGVFKKVQTDLEAPGSGALGLWLISATTVAG